MDVIAVQVMQMYDIRFDGIQPPQESPCGEMVGVCLFSDNTTNECVPFGSQLIADAIASWDIRIWPVGNGISHMALYSIRFAARLDFTDNRSSALATVYGVDLERIYIKKRYCPILWVKAYLSHFISHYLDTVEQKTLASTIMTFSH